MGSISLKVRRSASTVTGELCHMFVNPTERRCGLARTLLREVVKTASALGVRKLHLSTLSAMAEARQLYVSEGFRVVKEECCRGAQLVHMSADI